MPKMPPALQNAASTPAGSPPPSRTRGRPRDESIDERVLPTTLKLLSAFGYERFSIDKVVAETGIAKTTLYRRWPDKAHLVLEALCGGHTYDAAAPDTGSLREDLIALAKGYVLGPYANGDVAVIAAVIYAMRDTPDFADTIRSELVHGMRARSLQVIERAVQRNELDEAARSIALFHDIAPAIIVSRLLFTSEPVGQHFFDELVDGLLLPILRQAQGFKPVATRSAKAGTPRKRTAAS